MMFNLANAFGSRHEWGMMSGYTFGLLTIGALLFFILMIAVIVLKGYSLWHAAKRGEKGWFVAILILNTLGILELCYLYFVVGKWHGKGEDKVVDNKSDRPTV